MDTAAEEEEFETSEDHNNEPAFLQHRATDPEDSATADHRILDPTLPSEVREDAPQPGDAEAKEGTAEGTPAWNWFSICAFLEDAGGLPLH